VFRKKQGTGLKDSAESRFGKDYYGPSPFMKTTGAVNEVSIVTLDVATKDVLTLFSLAPWFLGGIFFFTAGALIETQRFFPDAMYW